jgi:hypothetical protein
VSARLFFTVFIVFFMVISGAPLVQALNQRDCPVTRFSGVAVLDLFTNKDGRGSNASGGIFYPSNTIAFYASVTYNGEGVADVLVAYEVRNPLNHAVVYSTARSNLHGIAKINFTIPSAPPEEIFGIWTAVATASVAQRTVRDWLTFQVIEDPPLLGDANFDGTVDVRDATLLSLAWKSVIGDSNFNPNCDFNRDGVVDVKDAAILSLHWGQTK